MSILNDEERRAEALAWYEDQEEKHNDYLFLEEEIRANRDLIQQMRLLLKEAPFWVPMNLPRY